MFWLFLLLVLTLLPAFLPPTPLLTSAPNLPLAPSPTPASNDPQMPINPSSGRIEIPLAHTHPQVPQHPPISIPHRQLAIILIHLRQFNLHPAQQSLILLPVPDLQTGAVLIQGQGEDLVEGGLRAVPDCFGGVGLGLGYF